MGVRLIIRTTRSLTLTEEGARFYERCVRILAEVEDAEAEATSGSDTALGLLRVTSTFAFGNRWLAPLLQEFQSKHPRLHVHLDTRDSVTNIVESGYDLAGSALSLIPALSRSNWRPTAASFAARHPIFGGEAILSRWKIC